MFAIKGSSSTQGGIPLHLVTLAFSIDCIKQLVGFSCECLNFLTILYLVTCCVGVFWYTPSYYYFKVELIVMLHKHLLLARLIHKVIKHLLSSFYVSSSVWGCKEANRRDKFLFLRTHWLIEAFIPAYSFSLVWHGAKLKGDGKNLGPLYSRAP